MFDSNKERGNEVFHLGVVLDSSNDSLSPF